MITINFRKKSMEDVKEIIDEEIDDTCDLDPNKICDSCGKCLEEDKNYKIIKITKIITD